jgi:threonine dehydratase
MGIKATIVMPKQTPFVKIQGCEKYGANVIVQGNGNFNEFIDKRI